MRLIKDLKERGLEVVLYPFVMMDIPAGNALAGSRTGGAGPAGLSLARAHHLRSRRPAGPASPDGTAAARGRRSQRVGFARGWAVSTGMVAALCRISARSAGRRRRRLHHRQRARRADARALRSRRLSGGRAACGRLPATCAPSSARRRRSSMRPTGPNTARMCATAAREVRFPLDPLLAHAAIDAVGIDYYPPISDWRDGPDHADLARGAQRQRRRLPARAPRRRRGVRLVLCQRRRPRSAQTRTPITDGAYGKPWVFRAEGSRVAGGRTRMSSASAASRSAATAWPPQSKPIWLTEIGIPAVDKGPNGPNVFPDPKSSESAYPPFSRGARDDLIQARGARGDPVAFRSRAAGFRADVQSGLVRLWRAHGRSGPHVRLGLGRAAVSGLSGFRPRVGGRRQLGDRPLDHGPDRGRGPRPADRRDPDGFRDRRCRPRSRSTVSWTAM